MHLGKEKDQDPLRVVTAIKGVVSDSDREITAVVSNEVDDKSIIAGL